MRLPAVVLTAVLSIASIPAFASNLIVNGGFETSDLTGWATSGFTFSQVAPSGFLGYFSNSGSYYLALGDTSLATLSQTFADTSGQQYQLSFFVASDGKTPNEFTAAIDGLTLFDGVNIAKTGTSSPYPYVQHNFTFTGTGSDTLTLGGSDLPSYLALDDISVTPASSGIVPEPSTLLLLATGLATLATFRRRVA